MPDIRLEKILRDGSDPFTCLAYRLARREGISPKILPDLRLSYFCFRVSPYPFTPRYSPDSNMSLDRNQLATALLRRGPEDILSDKNAGLAEWISLNSPNDESARPLDAALDKRGRLPPAEVKEIFRDHMANTFAGHRRIVPQSDLRLATAIASLPGSGSIEIPDRIFATIYQSLQAQGVDTSKINRNLYKLEFFRKEGCCSRSFLESRAVLDKSAAPTPIVDVNFGAYLTYNGKYCCLFSGMPLDDGKTFLVAQLQGSGIDRSLRLDQEFENFRIQNPHITKISAKVTLMLAIEYARYNSFKRIAVVPGNFNLSAIGHEDSGDMKGEEYVFDRAQARRIYDGSARQLRFGLFDVEFGGYHTRLV